MEWFVFVWIGFAVVTALAASARGRSPVGWGLLGLIVGLFALIAVLVMKDESRGGMMRRRPMLFLAAFGALAACSAAVPVTGNIGQQPAQGQATARASGDGTFFVLTPRGLRCEGTYDSLSTQPTLTAPVTCNDGRTGTVIITRSLDLLSGTVIGELSDGTPAQFVFGNLSYGQAFGVGGAQTSPLR